MRRELFLSEARRFVRLSLPAETFTVHFRVVPTRKASR